MEYASRRVSVRRRWLRSDRYTCSKSMAGKGNVGEYIPSRIKVTDTASCIPPKILST